MLAPSVHPLLWLFGCVLIRGTTASTDASTVHPVADRSQSTNPEVKTHTSEPSVKSTAPIDLNLTCTDKTTTTKSSSIPTTPTLPTRNETSNGSRSTTASSTRGEEPKRNESTTTAATQGALSLLSEISTSTSEAVTPTLGTSGYSPVTTLTYEKSPLTVAAFGVISFIVILVVVVIILVSVVSLRFKCNRSKDSEDKQKPGSSMVSESCSAGTSEKDNSITLISMKNINMNNSMSYPPSEKVL
ncbi:endothelial cell-specific chemotaxis regulator isoform X1 [Aythya fuligula]|uniref:Endothelial cell-specific chemotaxis regulator isoform X1 n=1 Tax=Aythya fuligula TaxID=219594 RepID=A0A6J3DMT8_AYTFU|nr:endothelial cell-specific chemotaxis regulator isoform X1 [Aythya fuligula]